MTPSWSSDADHVPTAAIPAQINTMVTSFPNTPEQRHQARLVVAGSDQSLADRRLILNILGLIEP